MKPGSKKEQGGEAAEERQLTQGWTAVMVSVALDCLLEEDKVALLLLATLLSGLHACTDGGLGASSDFREA